MSILVSNFLADFIGHLLAVLISKQHIFVETVRKSFRKVLLFFGLRTLSILFLMMVSYFYAFAIEFIKIVGLHTNGFWSYLIAKSVMIPLTLVVNFLISYLTIDYLISI